MEKKESGLSRRSVLGAAAGTGAAALVAGPLAVPALAGGRSGRGHGDRLVPRGRLGIQTFTVRDKVGELGYPALLEALASYGYEEIELFGGFDAAEVRQALDDNGLRAVGRHVGYSSFLDNLEEVLDDAEVLGLPYIGTANNPGRYGNTVAGYQQAAEDFNNFGAAAKARGMGWYQHNHDGEFAFAEDNPDVRLYDVLLAETDPDLVFLQLDVFWAYVGQYRFSSRRDADGNLVLAPFDPLDYVLAQPERYPMFHIKDGVFDTGSSRGYAFTDVGDGNHDYERFIREVEDAHSHRRGRRRSRYHHYIVERDDAPGVEPDPPGSLRTAQRSAAFLRSLRNRGR
jgi:sugar phosphate isomerase/epimerase